MEIVMANPPSRALNQITAAARSKGEEPRFALSVHTNAELRYWLKQHTGKSYSTATKDALIAAVISTYRPSTA
jgi:hypothetical protein